MQRKWIAVEPGRPARRALAALAVAVTGVALLSCGVSKDEHAAVVKKAKALKTQLAKLQKKDTKKDQTIGLLAGDLAKAKIRARGAERRASAAESAAATLKRDFAKKLRASEKEVEKLAQERLEAEKTTRLLKVLTGKLQPFIKKHQIALRIVHGRMVIKLRSRVLFTSGSAKLLGYGQRTLKRIAKHLKEIEGSHFQVAGHTDNVKITKGEYKDNWELSTARALTVVKFLQENGVGGEKLSAAGFGEFQPVATNKRSWGRRMNRRIEITVLPQISRTMLKKRPWRGKGKRRSKSKRRK